MGSDGELVDRHLRLKAARELGKTEVPVILCEELHRGLMAITPLLRHSGRV